MEIEKDTTYEDLKMKIYVLSSKINQLKNELKVIEARRYPYKGRVNVRDFNVVYNELESSKELMDNYKLKLYNTPRIFNCGHMEIIMIGRYEYDIGEGNTIKLSQSRNWYCPQDRLHVGRNTEIETDNKNIPIKITRYVRSSDTNGELFAYVTEVSLDYYPKDDIRKPKPVEEIKPYARQDTPDIIIEDIDQTIRELPISVDQQLIEYECPKCKARINLGTVLRTLRCPNCTKAVSKEKILSLLKENTSVERYIEKEHKTIERTYLNVYKESKKR
jgi:DNA-directed RNA polymerase subunit RPC12/RpoP